MGCQELIQSLREGCEERIRAARAEAEQEVRRVREDAARRRDAVRAAQERKRSAEAARHAETIMAEANAAVRRLRIAAERTLAGRLQAAALAALPALRNEGYRDVFLSFVRELPRFSWKTVKVNPADVELARGQFNGAAVTADQNISGGLDVATEDAQVRAVNTFEKRLERIWEELLPDLIRDVKELKR